MTVLLPLAVLTGLAVLVVYGLLCRRGGDPLGPRPAGELPDTRVAFLAGMVGWVLAQEAAAWLLAGTDVRRYGGYAAHVFSWTAVNALVAAALLPSALRGTRRPSLPGWRLAAAGVLGAAVVFAVQAGVGSFIQTIYEILGRGPPQQQVVDEVRNAHPSDVVALAMGAVALAPFAEEVFFRGILLPAAARVAGERTGLVLQALAFGAIHVVGRWDTWPLAVPLAIVGWGAGWIYLRTGSLGVSILLHAAFNAINFAAIRSAG